ncbi:hypothetical protein ACFFQW_01680 [Umezawaea endophytica]|uniref:Uncharacterized protein n=1 Tax=Umezawaea endophytica TaxID=1654476 RepID=A0A9X2VKR0_9PSEU|nr:hypothetical protein [Umezawaea endophytica]MCS7476963.1 hypothetical protein [Umezawaea endophytica]
MSRSVALVAALVTLTVTAGTYYLCYRLIAWGVAGDYRDLWTGGIYALFLGYLGLFPLAAAIGATYTAATGRKVPQPRENAGTPRRARANGYAAGIDDGDGDSDD